MNCWTSIWHFFFTVKMNVSPNSRSMRTLFLVFRSITFSIIFNVAPFVPFELTIDAWFVCKSNTQIDAMLTISALNTESESRPPEYCSWKTVYCLHMKYNDYCWLYRLELCLAENVWPILLKIIFCIVNFRSAQHKSFILKMKIVSMQRFHSKMGSNKSKPNNIQEKGFKIIKKGKKETAIAFSSNSTVITIRNKLKFCVCEIHGIYKHKLGHLNIN